MTKTKLVQRSLPSPHTQARTHTHARTHAHTHTNTGLLTFGSCPFPLLVVESRGHRMDGFPTPARAAKLEAKRKRRIRKRRGYTALGFRHTGDTSSDEDSGGNTSSSSEWDPTAEDQEGVNYRMGLYDDDRFQKLNRHVVESAIYRDQNHITQRILGKVGSVFCRLGLGSDCCGCAALHPLTTTLHRLGGGHNKTNCRSARREGGLTPVTRTS